jgi:hypothetical protein
MADVTIPLGSRKVSVPQPQELLTGQNYVTTDGQSVSQSVYLDVESHLGSHNQMFFAVRQLLFCPCSTPSLTTRRASDWLQSALCNEDEGGVNI